MIAMRWARIALLARNAPRPSRPTPLHPEANKGLDRKILGSLPRVTYKTATIGSLSECAICLTQFVEGDGVRVLPQCSHAFHVNCIDTWFNRHSSCPSCRDVLVGAKGEKCGGLSATHGSVAEINQERQGQ